MRVYRRESNSPYVTVHEDPVLDAGLSVTSRLLYVVLHVRADDGITMRDVAPLLGLGDEQQLRSFVDELVDAGVVETRPHHGRTPSMLLYVTPLSPERRMHGCVPCGQCGECSCEHIEGLCRICDRIARVEDKARQDIARWKQQRDAGATYAIATRLHRWDCPSLSSPEKGMIQMEASRPHARKAGALFWPRLPDLYTAQELRLKGCRRRRCAMCGPDPL